jgi:signal transduction histidine kinase/membrane-bound lytic murein transglycosylase MltF
MTGTCRKYLCILIGVMFLYFAGISPAAAQTGMKAGSGSNPRIDAAEKMAPKFSLYLTDKEKAWLSRHKTIRVAFDGYFPPYSFLNDAGQVEGLAVDVFRLLAERTGFSIEISPEKVWKDLYEAAQRRQIDAVATMGIQPERKEWFAFTKPYIFKSLVIMTRSDNATIAQPEDLAGKQVALVEKYQYVKPLLDKYPSIKPYYVDTMLDGLNAVAVGKADAAITFLGAGHYLQTKYQIANLKFAAIYDRDRFTESIAVRKDWPELAAILDKALDSVSDREMQALQEKWLPAEDREVKKVVLTDKEKAWIRDHPVIRIGINPEFAPYAYMSENGTFIGIASDYIKLLNKRLGLNMQVVTGLTWKEVVERAKVQQIDVIPGLAVNEERKAFLGFSDPYINFYRVIIDRKGSPFLPGIEDIRGLRVAVQADTAHEAYLKEHTDIKPLSYKTLQEALLAVSGGKADALVHNLASATFWIARLNLTNLKVAAPVSAGDGTLHIAVRKDWPELTGIINKGLATIWPEEKVEIQRRWVGVDYTPGITLRTLFCYLAVVIGIASLIIALFMVSNRMLKREVLRKTADLQKELAARKRTEEEIFNLSKFPTENPNPVLRIDSVGDILYANAASAPLLALWERQVGQAAPDDWREKVAMAWNNRLSMELEIECDGRVFSFILTPIAEQGYLNIYGRDITERKQAEKELRKHRDHLEKLVKEHTASLTTKTKEITENQLALMNIVEDLNETTAELAVARDRAEGADKLKSAFLATMSHELRTPLNSIIGFTGIVLQVMSGPLNEEQAKQLGMVQNSANHLLDLINDILDISKIEAGQVEIIRRPFDMRSVIEAALRTVMPLVEKKGLSLDSAIASDVGVIISDRRRVQQILINLVSNAVKFTEQGKIRVSAKRRDGVSAWKSVTAERRIGVSAKESGADPRSLTHDVIEISVADTGIGIKPEEMDKLFKPFCQIDTGLARNHEGTGLGLSICKKLVEMLGGTIRVESEWGKGSAFTFTLPLS